MKFIKSSSVISKVIPAAYSRANTISAQSQRLAQNEQLARLIRPASPSIQPKLTIGAVNDPLEQQADAMADRLMRMPDPQVTNPVSFLSAGSGLQRKCADCEQKEKQLQRKETNDSVPSVGADFERYVGGLSGGGQPLSDEVRSFYEPRFGYDFSQVKVHTDGVAAKSAQSINALAFTSGNNIVFNSGQYAPTTDSGKRLLGHELTHVVQQQNAVPSIMRFSDTGHHVIEEAALAAAGFSEEQRRGVEQGNIGRDYSQVGKVGNFFLLCKPTSFGGYKKEEHFDNFMWDVVQQRWRTRGPSPLKAEGTPVDIGPTPIEYIYSELESVIDAGLDPKAGGLVHLGNAFHTIEDFFAHSNFVELMSGDTRFGSTLLTGDFGKTDELISLSHVFEGVSPRLMKEYYRLRADKILPQTNSLSHSRIAHDTPDTPNYTLARRLAALVIQQLSGLILEIASHPEYQRDKLMSEKVYPKIERYLRPPSKDDQWWITMQAEDNGKIDKRLEEAERKTRVTVNQCMISPLKNMEVSAESNIHIPFGVALPINLFGSQAFFQAGAGMVTLTNPSTMGNNRIGQGDTSLFLGAQLTAQFDLF